MIAIYVVLGLFVMLILWYFIDKHQSNRRWKKSIALHREQRWNGYQDQIDTLNRRVRILEYPPKYKVGDLVVKACSLPVSVQLPSTVGRIISVKPGDPNIYCVIFRCEDYKKVTEYHLEPAPRSQNRRNNPKNLKK